MKKPNTESKAKSNKGEELKIDSFSVNRVHQFENGGGQRNFHLWL